jgi:SecY interacting protein Syd
MNVNAALTSFLERYQAKYPRLTECFDASWRSPCEEGEPWLDEHGVELIEWRPIARSQADDFAPLERALEMPIHPDIKLYYGSFWSGGLEATAADGHVSLILLWNPADAQRLTENLIGHALAKRRARAPFTVFFACTEPESDLFLSVDNSSGAVVLEAPGAKPIRTVAPSLADFLGSIEPAAPVPHSQRMIATL